jgi:DNA-binding transcriptional MerR regulator
VNDDEEPAAKDYATTEAVSEVAGVERMALNLWVRAGLLPAPKWTGGRGVIAKWPLVTLKIARFVRSQRDLGFGLQELRPAASHRRSLSRLGGRTRGMNVKRLPPSRQTLAGHACRPPRAANALELARLS